MAFLELKNIGKIYVNEGNVSVGIRGVNLSFDKGEFVAVTGESGSGKSTLLNVISGMDSYEEGEMLIEGQPTSHYLEPERELYREQYISFIFQNYNILESFTVLQNVELALMNSIPDKKARRARAIELLSRVGMGNKLRQRGSKLSGGQKQRTVIARALAKDSPIILADEPTGNLDSESAKEIIALLKEVARDRLLIVVTHNFEEVAGYATREIRVFDGTVASDILRRPAEPSAPAERIAAKAPAAAPEGDPVLKAPPAAPAGKNKAAGTAGETEKTAAPSRKAGLRTVKNGVTLGRAMFSATPRLSLFICLLMLLGALGLLSVTASCGRVPKLLAQPTMFAPSEGRLVVTRNDGAPLSDRELGELAEKTGAVSTLHYDYLLDAFQGTVSENSFVAETGESCGLQPVYGQHYKEKLYGREPEAQNEALLYLPVSYRPKFGMKDDFVRHIAFCELEYDVVGVQYYYDNNLTPKLVLTEDGFACAMAAFLLNDADQTVRVGFQSAGGSFNWQPVDMILPSFLLPEGRAYVSLDSFTAALDARTAAGSIPAAAVEISAYFRINNSFLAQFMGNQKAFSAEEIFPGDFYLREKPGELGAYAPKAAAGKSFLAVNVNSLRKLMEGYLAGSYTQASLFYASEKKAQAASDTLRTMGYTSALSTDKYSPQAYETVLSSAEGIFLLLLWILTVIFLSFFINLCTGKAIGAFRHDLAILRSMGIPVKTIIVGLFTRLYISLLPAVGFGLILALFLYRTPKGNAAFPYLYGWQYLMIFTGLLLMATRVGRKQVKKLFGESVREALRGGDEA